MTEEFVPTQDTFDFNNINDYVTFEFNDTSFHSIWINNVPVESDDLRMSNLSGIILEQAETLSFNDDEHDWHDVRAERGPFSMWVELANGDGTYIGRVNVDVHVNDAYADLDLPNGNKVSAMKDYSWADFAKLEELARQQEAVHADDFAAAVDSIPTQDASIEK